MEVSGQLHALPAGKEPLEPTGQEAGWAPEPFWTKGINQQPPSNFRAAQLVKKFSHVTGPEVSLSPSKLQSFHPIRARWIQSTSYFPNIHFNSILPFMAICPFHVSQLKCVFISKISPSVSSFLMWLPIVWVKSTILKFFTVTSSALGPNTKCGRQKSDYKKNWFKHFI
jgi:hypothetical protein